MMYYYIKERLWSLFARRVIPTDYFLRLSAQRLLIYVLRHQNKPKCEGNRPIEPGSIRGSDSCTWVLVSKSPSCTGDFFFKIP